MKRISYWFLSTLSALVLLLGYHTSTSGAEAASSSAVASTATAATAGAAQVSTGSSSTTKTLTGSVVSTQWGPVQVQITTTGDTITKVTLLQQTSGNPKDDEINARALPILIQETKQAGSAKIDMVSGATVTSTGYIQSLQSALDQA